MFQQLSNMPLSLEDDDIYKLSVLTDPTNEESTRIKRKICMLDHPKKLVEVIHAKLVIAPGLTGNNITTGPNQYCFNQTSPDGEVLRIFHLKSTEFFHKNIASLIVVMNHVVNYFGPKVSLSNQKRYICYKM